jgi:hypothetical protein
MTRCAGRAGTVLLGRLGFGTRSSSPSTWSIKAPVRVSKVSVRQIQDAGPQNMSGPWARWNTLASCFAQTCRVKRGASGPNHALGKHWAGVAEEAGEKTSDYQIYRGRGSRDADRDRTYARVLESRDQGPVNSTPSPDVHRSLFRERVIDHIRCQEGDYKLSGLRAEHR